MIGRTPDVLVTCTIQGTDVPHMTFQGPDALRSLAAHKGIVEGRSIAGLPGRGPGDHLVRVV